MKIIEEFTKNKRRYLKIQCDCGLIFESRKDYNKTNCGCNKKSKKDLLVIGSKFNRLTITSDTFYKDNGLFVNATCECGGVGLYRAYSILNGDTTSCGCYNKEILSDRTGRSHPMYQHGLSNSRSYYVWYHRVRSEWDNFEEFYKLIGDLPENKYIGKIDYNKPYSISNCIIINKEQIQEKIIHTNKSKYGLNYYTQSEDFKNRKRRTNINKYGFPCASQNPTIKQKLIQTKINRGQKHIYEGKSFSDLAEETGYSISHIRSLVRMYGYEIAVASEKTYSNIELKIKQFLDENTNYVMQYKVDNKIADFYLPDHNIIIECDGLYWHSDAVLEDKQYHKNKRNLYISRGLKPFFFRENEIINKLNIVKSIILSKWQAHKVAARKCDIVNVDKVFFNENHLMGAGSGQTIGLSYNGDIVCGIQYYKINNQTYISRMCNKLNTVVVGGLSRLLSKLDLPICSFVDLRYGNGHSLEQLGFVKTSESLSFKWTKGYNVYNRRAFLGNSGYKNGLHKIWDCGQAKYEKIKH